MGIQLSKKKWAPEIMCDACKKPITRHGHVGGGNVLFSSAQLLAGAPTTALRFVHRDTCDVLNDHSSWMPLDEFLRQLNESLKPERRKS